MAKRKDYGYFEDVSESVPWNVAKGYSELKVLKWLFHADEYEVLAEFGTLEMNEDLLYDPAVISLTRIKALYRLVKTLQLLINNSYFEVTRKKAKKGKKSNEEIFKGYLDDLERLKSGIKGCYTMGFNEKESKQTYTIKEKEFHFILNKLIEIKREVNIPINNAGMIFTYRDMGIDPDELKKKIEEDIIFSG